MTFRWVAERLDRACIELAIVPTLPVLTKKSGFARLRLAEERTETFLTDDVLFPEPPVPKYTVTQTQTDARARRKLTMSWASPQLALEQSWFAETQRVVHVKSNWYLRASPRPLVVLLGGFAPFPNLNTNILWPIKQLVRAGYDVVIPQWSTEAEYAFNRPPHRWVPSPGSGTRQIKRQVFPSRDPSRNIIELAKATTIIGQLLRLARDLGHDSVVVWGTSLGAHLVALLATHLISVHANLYLLEKPLCRLSDPTRFHGRGTNVQRVEVANRLDKVYRCVAPLDRPPRVDAKNIVIIGGDYDQITPISGAQLLADHFGVPLIQIAASHLFDPHRTRRILESLRQNLRR